eukprot:4929761-Prymnesium_polylepis.1
MGAQAGDHGEQGIPGAAGGTERRGSGGEHSLAQQPRAHTEPVVRMQVWSADKLSSRRPGLPAMAAGRGIDG